MSQEKQLMQYYLMQILSKLSKAGVEDFTVEDVSVSSDRGKLVVHFYTEEQWLTNPAFKATIAQQVMKQSYKGSILPDHKIDYKDVIYFVKVIK